MVEKDTIFSSRMKYTGVFSFKDFYKFCYDWLKDEAGFMGLIESKYQEKIEGNSKKMEIKWQGNKKLTDYFRFDIEIDMKVEGLQEIEVAQGGAKIKTNKGAVEMAVKGVLVRDYDGKFESTAAKKFMRGVYEKWIIASAVDEYRGGIARSCDNFISQAKAYLDIEGKK